MPLSSSPINSPSLFYDLFQLIKVAVISLESLQWELKKKKSHLSSLFMKPFSKDFLKFIKKQTLHCLVSLLRVSRVDEKKGYKKVRTFSSLFDLLNFSIVSREGWKLLWEKCFREKCQDKIKEEKCSCKILWEFIELIKDQRRLIKVICGFLKRGMIFLFI